MNPLRFALGASLVFILGCLSSGTVVPPPPVTTGTLKADVLYLNLLNRTTMAGSADSTGYADGDVYLIVTGRPGAKLPIQRLNWTTGKFEPMDHAKDNSVALDYVPLPSNLKYAPYWTTLAALKASSLYDAEKGLLIPTPVYSGRMHISFGRPVYLRVADDDKTAAEPSEADTLDPSYNTIWDKFEFTANTDHVLYSNTTCVDFVGIPLAYKVYRVQLDGTKVPAGGPAGFDLSSAEAAADPMTYLIKPFMADAQLKVLLQGARLLAPKVETDLIAPFGKGTYMDPYIQYCWGQYHTKQTEIPLFGYVDIPKAENSSVATDAEGKGVRWEATGKMTNGNAAGTQGSLTFKVTKLAKGTKAFTPPAEAFTIGLPGSWDTLRQGGTFQVNATLHTKTYTQAIDGDIKNQVSTALNRSVMHGDYQDWFDPKDTSKGKAWWAKTSVFFQQNEVPDAHFRTNHYARLMHEVSLDKKCYALAYDDKYGQNINLSAPLGSDPTVMEVSLHCGRNFANAAPLYYGRQSLLLGDKTYRVEAVPNAACTEAAIVFTPPSDVVLDKCWLLYQEAKVPVTQYPITFESFPAYELKKDGAVWKANLRPDMWPGAFTFVFKFQVHGQAGESLLPGNANASDGQVLRYTFSNVGEALALINKQLP